MSETGLPQVSRSYLSQLRSALVGVPDGVASDIVDGAREELAGLDAPAAAVRIEELGDPVFIAAEAREATGTDPQVPGVPRPSVTGVRSESRGFVVFISLLVALGGFVVPVVGWVVGIVMLWLSGAWRRWEKLLVTFGPFVVAALASGVFVVVQMINDSGEVLSPGSFALWITGWNAIVMAALLTTVFGIWALVRAYPRTSPR